MQPFIMDIDENGLKGIHFDDKIKEFYKVKTHLFLEP